MKAILKRREFKGDPEKHKQTIGDFSLYDEDSNLIFTCYTLELPYRDNEKNNSCIPTGTYEVVPRVSNKYHNHYILKNTSPRELILIHYGNYYTNTEGCILVGSGLVDINKDGLLDVTNSKATLTELRKLAPKGFELTIE